SVRSSTMMRVPPGGSSVVHSLMVKDNPEGKRSPGARQTPGDFGALKIDEIVDARIVGRVLIARQIVGWRRLRLSQVCVGLRQIVLLPVRRRDDHADTRLHVECPLRRVV